MYKLISHRGIKTKSIKENSYDAIKNALLSDKYCGVEFDLRSTKDNELIIYHDPIYKGKLISNTLYNELPKYVPKLQDILKIKSNKTFLIEIKNINNNYNKLINILNKHLNKKIYVMSFSNKIIKKLDVQNRNYKLGILNYVLNTTDYTINLDFIVILNKLLNEEVIKKLKSIEIFSYGVYTAMLYKNIYYIIDN